MVNPKKTIFFGISAALMMAITACSTGHRPSNSTFPNIDDAGIPDVLETTVGTLGDCYFSTGINDNPEYHSVLTVTFQDTTNADYTALMEHYQSASPQTDEDGVLIYDWGKLIVETEENSISINALIK